MKVLPAASLQSTCRSLLQQLHQDASERRQALSQCRTRSAPRRPGGRRHLKDCNHITGTCEPTATVGQETTSVAYLSTTEYLIQSTLCTQYGSSGP